MARCLDTRLILYAKQRQEERSHYNKRVSIRHISAKVSIPLQEHVCIKSVFNLVSKVIQVALVWPFFAS